VQGQAGRHFNVSRGIFFFYFSSQACPDGQRHGGWGHMAVGLGGFLAVDPRPHPRKGEGRARGLAAVEEQGPWCLSETRERPEKCTFHMSPSAFCCQGLGRWPWAVDIWVKPPLGAGSPHLEFVRRRFAGTGGRAGCELRQGSRGGVRGSSVPCVNRKYWGRPRALRLAPRRRSAATPVSPRLPG